MRPQGRPAQRMRAPRASPGRVGLARLLLQERGMSHPNIEQFMTWTPHTIGHDQTLATAHRMMNDYRIRHLPVLDGGRLVGIVSQRDLHLVETLKDVDPGEVQVSEAMSPDTFTVKPRSSVRKVAAEMAEHKYGSAVVMDRDRVVGVFTTIDALRALSTLLEEDRKGRS
jgi:acetoin utilization protein AcuB